MKPAMKVGSRKRLLWVILNLAGMTLYLRLASALWVSPGDDGTPGGSGDAFYWFFFLVPLLFAFVIANAVILFFILRQVRRLKGKAAPAIWLALATLWLAAVAFDHKKSLRMVDSQYGVATAIESFA